MHHGPVDIVLQYDLFAVPRAEIDYRVNPFSRRKRDDARFAAQRFRMFSASRVRPAAVNPPPFLAALAAYRPRFLRVLGAVLAFLACVLALRRLSRPLDTGRWYLFGVYCLAAALIVTMLHYKGY